MAKAACNTVYHGGMDALAPDTPALPLDAKGILELAARSMFHLFSSVSQGMFLVDRSGRIVWVNEGYQRFLPALGFSSVDQVDDVPGIGPARLEALRPHLTP